MLTTCVMHCGPDFLQLLNRPAEVINKEILLDPTTTGAESKKDFFDPLDIRERSESKVLI